MTDTVDAPLNEGNVEASAVETKATEVVTETKSDPITDIEAKVEKVVSENESVKANNAELEAKTAELTATVEAKAAELESKTAELEEVKAKIEAPAIHTNKSRTNDMESKAQFKTFLSDGIEGLRAKGDSLQITVDAQGGYAVPEELRQEIINIEHEISPLRQVASVASSDTSDVKQLVSVGDAASGWVGETDNRPNTNSPELAQRVAAFGEVYARPLVYQHMLEDAFYGVEAWVINEVARQFAEAEGVAFLTGDGTNKPVGILNGLDLTASAPADDAAGTFEVIANAAIGGADDAAAVDALRGVVASCATGYLPGAKWMMNRATHAALVGLKTDTGEYYLQRDLVSAAATSLFGFEIVINDDMADMGAGSCPIMFGDFARAFQIVDRVGVSMLRDPYTKPGAVSFYTRKRVGSMVLDASALKVVGEAA